MLKDTITKDPFLIGLLTTIPWGAAAIAMVVVGHRSDRTGERCWHVAISGLIGAIAFSISAIPGISGTVGLLALTVAAAGIMASVSTFWALPSMFVSGTAASASIAWINSVGNLGGYVSPALVGKIRDVTHNMTPALLMLASASIVSVILTVFFFRHHREKNVAA
jgi:nitrate/nitrite transporter NarK